MMVSDFDLERIVTAPDQTNSILVVDANTMLPLPVSPQLSSLFPGEFSNRPRRRQHRP